MWVVVPCLLEGRDQVNQRFPNRDKSSEGTIGDTAHQASASSHNPDLTGSPEYRDGDTVDEVRAWDCDKDLNDSAGVSAEQLVQLWITKSRAGAMPWLRYLIYNKRIWHKNNGWATQVYTGSDTHTSHIHINSDFTQSADTVTGTDWHLSEIGGATPVANPVPPSTIPTPPVTHPAPGPGTPFPLPSGFYFGPRTDPKEAVSGYFGRSFNGRLDRVWLAMWGSQMSARGWSVGAGKAYLTRYGNDGYYGAEYRTLIEAFQRDQHLTVDGMIGIQTWTAAFHNPVT